MRSRIIKQFGPNPVFHAVRRLKQDSRTMSITAPPVLRKAMEDSSEADILEEELYQYARYRWLSDESEKLAMRYRRFDCNALMDVAVNAVGRGARSCVKVLKCIEGQYNKAFLMTMDNGAEVLAKIPNPNAGPAFYTTASEVATRNFLREVLNFPVTRILAYSMNPLNPVCAEYIIEEKAIGKSLGSLWHQWPRESQLSLVTQLVDLEAKLASIVFQKHGCIYYKDDLKTKGLFAPSLTASFSSSNDPSKKLDASLMKKFALGPLTEAGLWEGERATSTLDRGPWNNAIDYMMAMGTNEIQWTKAYARPQMNYYRSLDTLELPDEYFSLLKRYLLLVPYLPPIIPKELHIKTLSHQDLHLDNIFVDPDTKKITCIIDWQSISVSEMFFQHDVPPMLPPAGSHGFDGRLEIGSEDSNSAKRPSGSTDILSHYLSLTRVKNPLRWAAINGPHSSMLSKPVSLVRGAWNRNDIFSFRHALITIVAHWKNLTNTASCPISFTDHELKHHESEMELLEGLGTVLHQLQDENLIPLGGRVLRENFDQAQVINSRVKDMFVNMAEDEQQKVLHSRIWPY